MLLIIFDVLDKFLNIMDRVLGRFICFFWYLYGIKYFRNFKYVFNKFMQ